MLIFLVPVIVHILGLTGLVKSDPISIYSGLATSIDPSILPGTSYIDPNVGFTSEALGHRAALDWLNGIIPWWNPYEGIGVPLAGEMQSAALFPLTLLLLFSNGQLYLHIVLQFISGIFTWILLKKMKFSNQISVVGALVFELNGTFSWFGHAPFNPVAFLPVILLGIEDSLSKNSSFFNSWRWIAIGISLSLYAGFPETAYIDGLFAFGWLIIRATDLRGRNLWIFLLKILFGGIVSIALSAPILSSFYIYIKNGFVGAHSGSLAFAHLPVAGIPMLFFPYIFGPIMAMSSYDTSGILNLIWGNIGGYETISIFMISIIALVKKSQIKLKLYLLAWIILSLMKTFGLYIVTVFINHIPLISNSAFYRYAPPSWEMAFTILVAFGLKDISYISKKINIIIFSIGLIILMIILLPAFAMIKELLVIHQYVIWLAVLLTWNTLVLIFIFLSFRFNGKIKLNLISVVLISNLFVSFFIPRLSNPRGYTLDMHAVNFLKSHIGLQRFYTLGPIAPNYGSYFGISSINYNDLPVPLTWANYVNTALNPNSGRITFTGTTQRNPLGHSPLYELQKNVMNYKRMGVKYIIVFKNMSNPLFKTISYGNGGSGNIAYNLQGKSILTGELKVLHTGELSSLSIFIGNYGDTSTGDLFVELSRNHKYLSSGKINLGSSSDNSYINVDLKKLIHVISGQKIDFKIYHNFGKPIAIWLWPLGKSLPEKLQLNGKMLLDKSALINLNYLSSGSVKDRLVYKDNLVAIYRLSGYGDYYTFLNGHAVMKYPKLNSVEINSKNPGILIRRELYFPGWKAYLNGNEIPVYSYRGLFESVKIPSGISYIRFVYSPPGIKYACIAFIAGILIFLFPVFHLYKRIKKGTNNL